MLLQQVELQKEVTVKRPSSRQRFLRNLVPLTVTHETFRLWPMLQRKVEHSCSFVFFLEDKRILTFYPWKMLSIQHITFYQFIHSKKLIIQIFLHLKMKISFENPCKISQNKIFNSDFERAKYIERSLLELINRREDRYPGQNFQPRISSRDYINAARLFKEDQSSG